MTRCISCEVGRAMGCHTYCCKLLVRLQPDEAAALFPDAPDRRWVDKAPDGWCVHLDRATHACDIWSRRPRVCREYFCNDDFLLQIALRHGPVRLVDLVRLAQTAYIPKETYRRVPEPPPDDQAR